MSSSITYNNHDFSQYVSAELIDSCGHAIEPRALLVPGRAGAVLLGGEVPPREVRVRLFMDSGQKLSDAERASVRHTLSGWLTEPKGARLALPGDPGVQYADAVCTEAGEWSDLFEGGSCEVAFTCYEPYAYGALDSSEGGSFTVGGGISTWPIARMVAEVGAYVQVADADTGYYVLVERDFEDGDVVEVDFENESVTVNGADAAADVTIASEFFDMEPGEHRFSFEGCTEHTVSWHERWV